MKVDRNNMYKFYKRCDEASLRRVMQKHRDGTGFAIVSACKGDWLITANQRDIDKLNLSKDNIVHLEDLRSKYFGGTDMDIIEGELEELKTKDVFSDAAERLNHIKSLELQDEIRKNGFTMIRTYGAWRYGNDDDFGVETSYMILPYDRQGNEIPFEELVEFADNMGRKFHQDSVLINPPRSQDEDDTSSPYWLATTEHKDYVTGAIVKPGETEKKFEGGTAIRDELQDFFTIVGRNRKGGRRFTFMEKNDGDVSTNESCEREAFELFMDAPSRSFAERMVRGNMGIL